jgi:hypothetical protein
LTGAQTSSGEDSTDGDQIFNTPWYYYIGGFPLRVYISFEIGFDESKPLLNAALHVSAAFLHIAQY